MAFCTNCGKQLPEGQRFCTECGTPLNAEAEPVLAAATAEPAAEPVRESVEPTPAPEPALRPAYTPQPQPVYAPAAPASEIPAKGSKYETISTGGFIGIFLLLCIPIVGLILMIVWACGGCRKLTKRNLARAMLLFLAVSLVLSFALGLIFKDRIAGVMQEYGVSGSDISSFITQGGGSGEGAGALGSLVSGLLGAEGSDIPDGLSGEGSAGNGGEAGGIDELMEGASQLQQDAEAQGSGWPSSLPRYPYGSAEEVASYRTEVTGTTKEEMLAYVDTLKANGYVYKDLYDFGFSEETMINDYNGWWGTNGTLYLSISISEGTVTIDYLDELPSLADYF